MAAGALRRGNMWKAAVDVCMCAQQYGFAFRCLGLCVCHNLRGGSGILGPVCLCVSPPVCVYVGLSVARHFFDGAAGEKDTPSTWPDSRSGAVAARQLSSFRPARILVAGGRARADEDVRNGLSNAALRR